MPPVTVYCIIICAGILHRESINERYTSRHSFDGVFHVRHHVARRVRRKLHVRDAICRNKRVVSVGHADRMLWISTSILQVASDQCLRGKQHDADKCR